MEISQIKIAKYLDCSCRSLRHRTQKMKFCPTVPNSYPLRWRWADLSLWLHPVELKLLIRGYSNDHSLLWLKDETIDFICKEVEVLWSGNFCEDYSSAWEYGGISPYEFYLAASACEQKVGKILANLARRRLYVR